MRIAPAAEWEPGAGTVIDWVPTERTAAAATAAPEHPIGPSFLQRDHIVAVLAQRADGVAHRAFTCAAVPVDGVLDVDRMTEALTGFLRDHEGWRSTFRVEDDDIVRGVVAPEDIELTAITHPDGTSPLDHIHGRLPETAVFDAFPAVAFGAVIHEDSFDLYFGIDHAYGDASSQAIGLAEILGRYRGDPDHPRALPDAGHITHTATEYERAAHLTGESASVRRWRAILAAGEASIPTFPLDLGIVDGVPQPVHVEQVRIADAARAARLAAWAKSVDSGLSSVVFAGLAVTEYRLAGRERYLTATVLSTRRGGHVTAQGWYINFVPVAFPVSGGRIVDVLDEATAALGVAREMAADPVHGALGVLIGAGELDPSVIADPQMVSYLDFRWFPAARALRDAVIFTGEGITDHASIWISRTEDGLFAGTQRPANPIAAASVQRYFQTLREALAQADPESV